MSKKIISLFLALLLMGAMTVLAEEITVTDAFGREVILEGPITRIVALEPSDCEILYALGCGDALVGRGEYCDYPSSVMEVTAVQSGANMNLEEILVLDPQLVIMCDISYMDEQVSLLEQNGVKVISTEANNIAEVYDAIDLIGRVMGKEAEAERLVADMQAAFADIAAKSEKNNKTIYFEVMPLEWGLWSAGTGTFMHELAEICGMQNAFADIEGWQAISQEQVMERNPDYIVLVTGMGETAVDEVMGREGWGDINAIKNGKVYNADSYALTRPAPRLMEAAMDLYNFLNGITEGAATPAAQ
ncbi:MAG: ABC transporter substrate-binding protein [Clostridiales bacterium]|nr:ABC transporter substrate-binding protein [Clostridiales bacterium]